MNCIIRRLVILIALNLTFQAHALELDRAIERLSPALETAGVDHGDSVFIRIFKHDSRLELFVEGADGAYQLVKTYPICAWSGDLGPKLREGDSQSPEGFYWVSPGRMNPNSTFHLSFNLGFPNTYDRAHDRTGSYLMVHGACVSIGCYAMTDPAIEEIYALMQSAFAAGQPFVRVHIFPYDMSKTPPEAAQESEWLEFWAELKRGHDWFEQHRRPPEVTVAEGRYVFSDS